MVLDFLECHIQIQHGKVSIYWNDDTLSYKEVHCNLQNQVESLHQSTRRVMNYHTIPNYLPIFTIDERDDPVLMVKCVNSDPFLKVKIDWCFQKVLVSNDPSMNISAFDVMYRTEDLKKFMLSVVNTVVAFVVFPFWPILDFWYKYVGENNNGVFTSPIMNQDVICTLFNLYSLILK